MKKFFYQKTRIKAKAKRNLLMETKRNGEFKDCIVCGRKVLFKVIKVIST